MSSAPFIDEDQIDRFVQTLCVGPKQRRSCAAHLNGFRRFIHASDADSITVALIRRWLRRQARKSPLYMVHSSARLIDRFLEWRRSGRPLSSNPLAQLRSRYRVRAMSKLVNALLTRHYVSALEELRPLRRFGSFLGPQMQADVIRKRALGYVYNSEEATYLRFDRFLQSRPDLKGAPLPALVEAWSQSNSRPYHLLKAHECGRNLSKALHRLDPRIPPIPIDSQLRHRVLGRLRKPRVLSESEIKKLLHAARRLPSPRAPWRPLIIYTAVVLTYCAGLRLGELARIKLADVHLEEGSIEIRHTKFFKSRRLPLAPSVVAALKRYLGARTRAGAPGTPESGLFWSPRRRRPYSKPYIEAEITAAMRHAGLKPSRSRQGPRVHDLRHAFVLHRMLAWYRSGINPQSHLPYLATYLGHQDISSTLVYLTQTEELQRYACERFRKWRKNVVNLSGAIR